jgi:DNA-binding transcriptional LysR family regulator
MDLRLLRSFIAVADDQNICRAANKLHLTQSALSRRIKALESELGVTLLCRRAHSFSLTHAGRMLHKAGQELLRFDSDLEAKLKFEARQEILRIGYSPSLTGGMLGKAMHDFYQRKQNVRIEQYDITNKDMLSKLREGTIDMALTVVPDIESDDIRWQPIIEGCWRVIMSADHPWTSRKKVFAADFLHQELVIFHRTEYPAYWARVHPWLRTNKIPFRIAAECDGISSLLNAVEAGVGISLVPNRSITGVAAKVASRPLSGGPAAVVVSAGVRTHSQDNDILKLFVNCLQRAVGK